VTTGNATANPGPGAEPPIFPAQGTWSGPVASGPSTSASSPAGPNPTPASRTEPTARQAAPDLIVTAVRVNGRAPDGKDDCKDGKNDVAVHVKNEGSAAASAFAVRIAVDGQEAGVVPVSGLEAGQEREVRFEDVRFKKGERTLTAGADPKGTIVESDETNNERKVTARCMEVD
jgi:hypothetical protein